MIYRRIFFSAGSGSSRLRPIVGLFYAVAMSMLFLGVETWAAQRPGIAADLVWAGAFLLAFVLFVEVVLVILGLQGLVGAGLAMGRKDDYVLPDPFDESHSGMAPIVVAFSIIATLYCVSAALLVPFTPLTYSADGCPQSTSQLYRFLLLWVNMLPGYTACIADPPPLLYRTARYIINLAILGTFLANLPALLRRAAGRRSRGE